MSANRNSAMLYLLAFACFSANAVAQTEAPAYRPPASEALQTPRFCWKEFMGEKFRGPEYSIPRETCGSWANHYCSGLIQLNRANRTIGNEGRKRVELLSARENTLYTLRGIRGYPHCPIRAHVENTLRIIDAELKTLR